MLPSARSSISRTRDESQLRSIRAWRATGGVGAALMMAMKSSMLARATARPSSTWPRSRALRSWKMVRRVTTSLRCWRKYCTICFRFSRRGWPSTSATMFMPKVSSSWVFFGRVLQQTLGDFTALELDDQAHAVLVRFVADVGDALDLLFVDQLGDAFLQGLLVHLIGNGVDAGGCKSTTKILSRPGRAGRERSIRRSRRPQWEPARTARADPPPCCPGTGRRRSIARD
ncbi:hypothetical protein CDEN61S_03202 [Castellaniella denitrificans]